MINFLKKIAKYDGDKYLKIVLANNAPSWVEEAKKNIPGKIQGNQIIAYGYLQTKNVSMGSTASLGRAKNNAIRLFLQSKNIDPRVYSVSLSAMEDYEHYHDENGSYCILKAPLNQFRVTPTNQQTSTQSPVQRQTVPGQQVQQAQAPTPAAPTQQPQAARPAAPAQQGAGGVYQRAQNAFEELDRSTQQAPAARPATPAQQGAGSVRQRANNAFNELNRSTQQPQAARPATPAQQPQATRPVARPAAPAQQVGGNVRQKAQNAFDELDF